MTGATTAFVATLGGHVSELVELAGRLPVDGPALWITNDSPQTRDLLAGRRVELVPFVGERDHRGVLRAARDARQLYRAHGVTTVVSTGSAIALGYLPMAAALGLRTHYVESSTRVRRPSVTGRILACVPGVRCWWQYDESPRGFVPLGGVFDRYLAVDDPGGRHPTATPALRRMVVTVGTTDRCFRRLIARVAALIPAGTDVLWQTGHTDVTGLDIDARPLVPEAELVAAVATADVVVCHAGAGSLSMALRAGRAPVFVPRRAAHGEQVDDHQVELAEWAAGRRLAVATDADTIRLHHLTAAARRRITTRPVGELVLR